MVKYRRGRKKYKKRFARARYATRTIGGYKLPSGKQRYGRIPKWKKGGFWTGKAMDMVRKTVPVPAIAPKVMLVHFRMCSFLLIDPTDTDKCNDTIVSLGDITDPHQTPASTSQPVGLDQWFAFYQIARVLTCKVNMRIEFNGLTAGKSVVVGFIPSRTADSFTSSSLSWTRWCEFPRARKWVVSGYYGATASNTDGRKASLRISYNVNVLKFWKSDSFIPRHEIGEFESALPHTSPTRSVFGHLLVNYADQTVLSIITYNVYFTFDWVVRMSERTDQMTVSTDA